MKNLNPVWISPMAFDPGATLLFQWYSTGSTLDHVKRRMGKIRTLDVDVSIVDGGYTEGDRTFRISVQRVTATEVDIAQRLIALHSRVWLSKRDGVWVCAPSAVEVSGESMTFVLESTEKLTA